MVIAAIICISAVVLAIVIVLTVLIYNQMLLLNEVNKRLLLMAKDSIERDRTTQEELQDALLNLEQLSNETTPSTPTHSNEQGFYDEDLEV